MAKGTGFGSDRAVNLVPRPVTAVMRVTGLTAV
jgi:hypothetical protein